MTINEYRKKLEKLNDEQFNKFKKDFGGDLKTREDYVRNFVDNPKHERRICQLLELKTEEEKITKATTRSVWAASISAAAAILALLFSTYIWHRSTPLRKPIFAPRKTESTHKEITAESKLLIDLQLQFLNIGKHPAGDVRFRSCFGPLSDPNQLRLSENDLKCANTVYPDSEYVPWEQLTIEDANLSQIRSSTLFYYCRLDYCDTFDNFRDYGQDFYFIYNIARKKLQHATSEQKQQFQQQINKIIHLK
jgi:hypothetical protein